MSLAAIDRHRDPATSGPCRICGFALWHPVGRLTVTEVGLYDDARFRGRLLVSLRQHHDHLDEVPADVMAGLTRDLQLVSRVLRQDFGAERVNVAILGNIEPHVHAHVIPRYGAAEPAPDRTPWQDPRPAVPLVAEDLRQLASDLASALGSFEL